MNGPKKRYLFQYVDMRNDIKERLIQKRLDDVVRICLYALLTHSYYPLTDKTIMLEAKPYSYCPKNNISTHRELLSIEELTSYVIREYNYLWWLALITMR